MTVDADRQETIPGLELRPHTDGALVAATAQTLQDLAAAGYLNDRHAARTALAISLARIIETKQSTGRLSTVANDARVLLDLLDGLVPASAAGVDDDLRQALDQWAEA